MIARWQSEIVNTKENILPYQKESIEKGEWSFAELYIDKSMPDFETTCTYTYVLNGPFFTTNHLLKQVFGEHTLKYHLNGWKK